MSWANRIIATGNENPTELLDRNNPDNWRLHPRVQQDALLGLMQDVGVVQDVIVNRRTGFLVDGHLRVFLAAEHKQPSIPVKYVDLTPAEEAVVLATFDPLADLAKPDPERLNKLLASVSIDNPGVRKGLVVAANRARQAIDAVGTGSLLQSDEVLTGLLDPSDGREQGGNPLVKSIQFMDYHIPLTNRESIALKALMGVWIEQYGEETPGFLLTLLPKAAEDGAVTEFLALPAPATTIGDHGAMPEAEGEDILDVLGISSDPTAIGGRGARITPAGDGDDPETEDDEDAEAGEEE